MQLELGLGNVTVSATINALIFKKLEEREEIGKDLNIKEYSSKIIDSYTLYF